jgi:TRAP-type C4-dicarboxylate transport system substrate-binding protein
MTMLPHSRLNAALLPRLAGALLLASVAAPQAMAQVIELKVSHYVPPAHTIHKEFTRWAEDLAQKSGGRLKLTVFPSGQMGPLPRQFDLARTGVADISFFIHGALPGRFPATEVAHLPYAFNRKVNGETRTLNISDASAITTSLASLLEKEHEGTRILYLLASPTVGLHMHKAKIRMPKDLVGLRIRHNGHITSAMVSSWGGSPVAMPPSELADALDKGTLDGMMFNFEAALAFQIAKSLKSVTALNATAATFAVVMNKAKYDSLPADLRRLIDETTGVEAARRIGALFDGAEAAGRKYLEAGNVEIIDPTPAEAQAFEALAGPLADTLINTSGDKGASVKAFQAELKARVAKGSP